VSPISSLFLGHDLVVSSEAANFIEKVAAISDIDRKKICHQTAEKLFKLS
jgi:hypothetical protein